MTVQNIVLMGHPVLKYRSEEIDDPGSEEVRALVADMADTLADAGGAGLAAPQIGVPWRVIVFHAPPPLLDEDGEGDEDDPLGPEREELAKEPLTVLINPEVEPLEGGMVEGVEACLSVPGLCGLVPRHANILYRGTTPEGELIEREAGGFHARLVQHEFDHLNGILYPLRMSDLSTLSFTSVLEGMALEDMMEEEFPEDEQ